MTHNVDLHISKDGEEIIKEFESLQLEAYVDTKDKYGEPIYAIGWGHTGLVDGQKIVKGQKITEEKAQELFLEDIQEFERKVKHYVKVPLNQQQFDALVSMAYNVRTSNFVQMIEHSELNKGRYDLVPDAMMHYNVSGGRILRGLTRRRKMEANLWKKEGK